MNCNLKSIRQNFPLLQNKKLIYFDNAATTQKPQTVIQTLTDYYQKQNANVNRGAYQLSAEATIEYEKVREKVAEFIHAKSEREVVFTKGTTQAINWIANGFVQKQLNEDDEIVVSIMEHHSNFLPWQIIAQNTHAKLKCVKMNSDYTLDMQDLKSKITEKTKFVAITAVSNVLGIVNPISEICKIAHQNNALVLVDAAQAVPSMPIDVQKWNADFVAFSGHKMLGPTGVGVLWGKGELLKDCAPLEYGGGMINDVSLDNVILKDVPWRFEGGTPNIAGVIGLGKAIDFLKKIGMQNILEREKNLTKILLEKICNIEGVKVYANPNQNQTGIVSFNIGKVHPHDVATFLDAFGIAIRTGHHCAIPLMHELKVSGTCRASLYFYNTEEEIEQFVQKIKKARDFFGFYQK